MSIGTVFSECGNYRYTLERTWVRIPTKFCMFLMLNPSTADDETDDNTIRRCIDYGKTWGYHGLYVGNLYAARTTFPTYLWQLKRQSFDIIGPQNDQWIRKLARKSEMIVAAWGQQAEPERVEEVQLLLNLVKPTPLHHLKLCKNGMPSHPLYLEKKLTPQKWSPQ